jgi:hypothetical protein
LSNHNEKPVRITDADGARDVDVATAGEFFKSRFDSHNWWILTAIDLTAASRVFLPLAISLRTTGLADRAELLGADFSVQDCRFPLHMFLVKKSPETAAVIRDVLRDQLPDTPFDPDGGLDVLIIGTEPDAEKNTVTALNYLLKAARVGAN